MSRTFFATCALGLEEVVTAELKTLGVEHVRSQRGRVQFHGPLATGYAACLWLRSASRVQEQLFRNRPAGSRQQLYDAVRGFDWDPILDSESTLAVSATVNDSRASDSRFVGLVVKDGIVDQLRDKHGSRPNVNTEDPDVPIRVIVRDDRATLLRDLSGASLHRRGWRPVQVKSPLNEATAAGLLQLAGWDGTGVLHDPMCGSGTFLVEAAHIAQDRAPGLRRGFAFERWLDFRAARWGKLLDDAEQRLAAGAEKDLEISGADHHAGALGIARRSLSTAGVRARIQLEHTDVAHDEPPVKPTIIVSNPPWGLRVDSETQEQAWTDLGLFLKNRCAGATAYLLSGDAALTRPLRLKAARRHPIRIAQVDARWIRYELREER
jgi:putative N6-adenine-specific DNA methylase